jgi:hypothetical protein
VGEAIDEVLGLPELRRCRQPGGAVLGGGFEGLDRDAPGQPVLVLVPDAARLEAGGGGGGRTSAIAVASASKGAVAATNPRATSA